MIYKHPCFDQTEPGIPERGHTLPLPEYSSPKSIFLKEMSLRNVV